jgi:hypothetical protein
MVLGVDVAYVSWCRCGPFAPCLDAIRSASAGDSFVWHGDPRWVAMEPVAGKAVYLGAADLCHQPGFVVGSRIGVIDSVLDGAHVSIEGRVLGNCEERTFVVQPYSLVGRLRVEPGLPAVSQSTQSASSSLKQRSIPMDKEGEWARITQHALEHEFV